MARHGSIEEFKQSWKTGPFTKAYIIRMRAEFFFFCMAGTRLPGFPLLVSLHFSHPGEGSLGSYDPLTKARQTDVVIE